MTYPLSSSSSEQTGVTQRVWFSLRPPKVLAAVTAEGGHRDSIFRFARNHVTRLRKIHPSNTAGQVSDDLKIKGGADGDTVNILASAMIQDSASISLGDGTTR